MPSQPPFHRSFSFDSDDDQGHFSQPPSYTTHVQPPAPVAAARPQDSFDSPPPPPVHRNLDHYAAGATGAAAYQDISRNPTRHSLTTPGMDNLGESAAGGGIAGIALGVANSNERESGLRALRDADAPWDRSGSGGNRFPGNQQHLAASSPYGYNPAAHQGMNPTASYGSQEPLAYGGHSPGANSSRPSLNSHSNHDGYSSVSDDPYQYHSRSAPFGAIDPNDIEDDGDDGIPQPEPKRKTLLGTKGAVAGAAAAGVGGAAALSNLGSRDGQGNYGPLPGGSTEYSHGPGGVEKAAWGAPANKNGKKRLLTIVLVALVVIAVIVGVVIGGVLGSRAGQPDDSKSGASAAADDANGDLDKNSDDIKKLMNNPDLHKVFPGMDYTPLNAQYPDCLKNPPSQNNITRDVAVLSQLTPAIRLYGTDCNQTEMVLHALDRLEITDVKVWLGVWLGNNDTTNSRQLSQMWEILDKHGDDPFAGVIVGNEVLYRKDLTSQELAKILGDTKKNLTSHNWQLPLATSDLGDNWTENLAEEVDVVMANIHPFFAGVEADQAASWTWSFWQSHDVAVTKNLQGKTHVISETGWPSGGGNDCGGSKCTSDTQGSVAGVDEMNTFLGDWVCQALKNGTDYFWFELFDEPWKIMYNSGDENWEDKWGLMTVDRSLKNGVKIPDCGGQQATAKR